MKHDHGYQILNDDEIVDEIHVEKEIEERKTNALKITQVHPHNDEAFECLETAMKWLERQKNVDPIQLTYLTP